MSELLLETHRLRKAFGALVATDDVSLAIRTGETHALIGPNGAGKTTLVGQLTGELKPDAGRISFRGRDITELATAQRARLGLARSFQITSIFPSFSAESNVALAVQARGRTASGSGAMPNGFRRCARRRESCSMTWASAAPATRSRPACRTASTASSSSAWRSPPIR